MNRREFIKATVMASTGAAFASPVKSNVGGSMTSLISSPSTPIDLPYVTDGLEAFWDGEWNIGSGMHDDTTTTWVDLSGHKRHMYAPAPLWGENYAYCDGTTMRQIFRQTAQESEWFAELLMSGRYTVEITQGMSQTRSDQYLICDRIENNWSMRAAVVNANNSGFKISMNGSMNRLLCTVAGVNYLVKRCHQLAAEVSTGLGGVNGTYKTYETDFVASGSYVHGGLAIGARGDLYSTPYYSNGLCVYRVSIYNRGLSQEELEFNLATDVERFGI